MSVSPDLQLSHVYTVYDTGEAEIVREALESEGIPCTVEDEQPGPSGIGQIRLLVPADFAADARAYLIDLEERFSDEEE